MAASGAGALDGVRFINVSPLCGTAETKMLLNVDGTRKQQKNVNKDDTKWGWQEKSNVMSRLR